MLFIPSGEIYRKWLGDPVEGKAFFPRRLFHWPPHRTKETGLEFRASWGQYMICSYMMRSHDIAWEKGGKKTIYGNSLKFRTFSPWKQSSDLMAESHPNFNDLDGANIQFSQANKMFPCGWITKAKAYLSVNAAIWAFVDILCFLAEPETLVKHGSCDHWFCMEVLT